MVHFYSDIDPVLLFFQEAADFLGQVLHAKRIQELFQKRHGQEPRQGEEGHEVGWRALPGVRCFVVFLEEIVQ